MIADKKFLVGRWNVVSWTEIYPDGSVNAPFGDTPRGFLLYEGDGEMVCLLAKPSREHFSTSNRLEGKLKEKAQAFDDFFVYAGKYWISDIGVEHQVELALFPNWEGTLQRRRIKNLSSERLLLQAEIKAGEPGGHVVQIEWAKSAGALSDKLSPGD